jgi:hypothetical protein
MPDNVAGESQPADDLRSVLASAVESQEALATLETPHRTEVPKDEAKTEPSKTEAEAEPSETTPEDKADTTRARTPDGKFASKEAAEPDVDAAAESEAAAEPEKKPEGLEAPASWKPEEKESFKKLPPETQKIVLDHQKMMDKDYSKKTEAIAALRKDWEPVAKIFEPYQDVMRQKGFTPRSLIESWANVEKRLADNPVEVISGLVRGYRVNPNQVAAALGIRVAPAAEGEAQTLPIDPQTTFANLPPQLVAELNQLKQQVGGLTQAQEDAIRRQQLQAQEATAAREAAVATQIEQFKEARDPSGNLLHPHFDEVEEDMTLHALAARAGGKAIPPLQDLYLKAVRANPSTYEKLRTAEMQQAEQKRKDEARAKAAAAKKAASSVTGAPGAGQSPQSGARAEKSLREQLEEATADALSA